MSQAAQLSIQLLVAICCPIKNAQRTDCSKIAVLLCRTGQLFFLTISLLR